jgi:tetratricopeptide (TPR) repeat protein
MAAASDLPGDTSHEPPVPGAPARRLREQSQVEFEIDFMSRLLERDPVYSDALRVHGTNLASLGHYARALLMDRRLVRLKPERPIPWYNLACSYTLLGLTDPAFAALQRALELGYRHFAHIHSDPDLDALRRDIRFARLMRRFEGRGGGGIARRTS